MKNKLKQIKHFLSVVRLYLDRTPYVGLILVITFIAGMGQVFASAVIVPIVSMFTTESSSVDFSDSVTINKYVRSLLSILGIEMSIVNLLILMFLTETFCYGLVYIHERLVYYSRAEFAINVRKSLLQNIMNARWNCLLNHSSGENVSRLTVETQRAGASVFVLLDLLVNVGYAVIFFTVFVLLYTKFAIVLFIIISISFYITRGWQYKSQQLGNQQTEDNNNFINLIVEFLRGIKFIKVSALEDYAYGKLDTASRINQQISKDIEDYHAKMNFFVSSFKSLTTAMIIIFALIIFKIQVSMIVLFFYLYLRIMPRISLLQNRLLSFVATYQSLENIEESRGKLIGEETAGDNKIIFSNLKQGVILKDVSFNYGDSKILDGINIEIHPKMTVGIAGPSGAGKTTLIDLVVGLHKPFSGEILIDSENLSNYNIKTWREKIGYVTQDDIMFNDTIWSNLIFGLSSVEQEWIEHCSMLANIHSFVMETPDGYKTVVGENGLRLSGGQRQRLSLARALIRKPELLILDEATSALDSESEKIIQNSIRDISHKMTILIIAHRLSTLADTDIIYIIDNGKVIEKGTYASLVRYDGYFSKMHKLQTVGTSL